MIFVDASALIAIVDGEDDAVSLAARLADDSSVYISPMVVYESITGLARKRACTIEVAERAIDIFIDQTDAQTLDITAEIGGNAVQAFNTFGRGRHKAALNMGDCFAYACAKAHDLRLLCKGNDFPYTDIEIA
ncbi:type II toxin-antitoxin system VapC family toxin [Phyllobacterium chamaecytisi]|uniref:type II toxin-antitoxin system VapC family toxin n=1 Tax=Phyllobacterium chamaecytisi TaxID=2876082 RepID=UPI001CCD0A90|nr:type II toxin-antitoxin system VapC family toxin [Phyllobacterium sp. KW56]MBZ9601567.1 type II toxin-antitoxin system VapC family toxin [Phyllobacterium sp. KW56]